MPELDAYLPAAIREWIEQTCYARIKAQASFEFLMKDPIFLADPAHHPAFYSDHGIVHVRDIASQVVQVLDTINGVLIVRRPEERLDGFMKGYGVLLAYLHDIGMSDFSVFGRLMHPEYAAHSVFDPVFDPIIETLWEENCGNIAGRLQALARNCTLGQEPKTMLRELLAMSCCHSKSKVPAAVLNVPAALRQHMIDIVGTDLSVLFQRQSAAAYEGLSGSKEPGIDRREERHRDALSRLYGDIRREAFCWLVSPHTEMQGLVDDVIDVIRTLRCASGDRCSKPRANINSSSTQPQAERCVPSRQESKRSW